MGVLLAWPAGAAAAPTITEFTSGLTANSGPDRIAAGPDGNLWFTEILDPGRIGRITPAGAITEFTNGLTANSSPLDIAAGPDGNLWFTEINGNRIGRITPAGAIVEFSVPSPNSGPDGIAAGPDGSLWFTERDGNQIGRITPAGVVTNEFSAGLTANSKPVGIAAGPDGNLWFTEFNDPGRIGRITPAGAITEFTSGLTANSSPNDIAAGPDGNLWFTENDGNRIGRITPAGVITEFTSGLTANSGPLGIAAGSDGNLWFTEFNNPGRIGRITPGPGALTGAATGVGASLATLNGTVRANGQITVFRFEYGTTTAYGSQTTLASAGAGLAPVAVSQALSGLAPDTLYHYRLTATNNSDTARGADRSFRTAPAGGGAVPIPPAKASFAGSKSRITVSCKRRFKFSFHATPGLKGSAVFKSVKKVKVSKRRKKKVTLARKSFSVPASGKVTLRIRLSKKKFRILLLNRKIRTRVTVTLKNAAGLTSKASKKITLKAPKRKQCRR